MYVEPQFAGFVQNLNSQCGPSRTEFAMLLLLLRLLLSLLPLPSPRHHHTTTINTPRTTINRGVRPSARPATPSPPHHTIIIIHIIIIIIIAPERLTNMHVIASYRSDASRTEEGRRLSWGTPEPKKVGAAGTSGVLSSQGFQALGICD